MTELEVESYILAVLVHSAAPVVGVESSSLQSVLAVVHQLFHTGYQTTANGELVPEFNETS